MDLDPGLSGPAVRGSMLVQPYLFFDGRCEEALEFYTSALGAEVTMGMHRKAADRAGFEDCRVAAAALPAGRCGSGNAPQPATMAVRFECRGTSEPAVEHPSPDHSQPQDVAGQVQYSLPGLGIDGPVEPSRRKARHPRPTKLTPKAAQIEPWLGSERTSSEAAVHTPVKPHRAGVA
jgi:hypothetical protein